MTDFVMFMVCLGLYFFVVWDLLVLSNETKKLKDRVVLIIWSVGAFAVLLYLEIRMLSENSIH